MKEEKGKPQAAKGWAKGQKPNVVKGGKEENGEKPKGVKPKGKAKPHQSSAPSAGQPMAGTPEPTSLMTPVKCPEELRDVLGSSPKKGCGSFTMTGPD